MIKKNQSFDMTNYYEDEKISGINYKKILEN
jgi:hypothetical protein